MTLESATFVETVHQNGGAADDLAARPKQFQKSDDRLSNGDSMDLSTSLICKEAHTCDSKSRCTSSYIGWKRL
jgi:hypothetical protein